MKLLYGLALIVICAATGSAQNIAPYTWKRLVTRVVDTRDVIDEKGVVHHNEYGDTQLVKCLVDAVLDGKINPYEWWPSDGSHFSKFTTKMPRTELMERMHFRDDTVHAPSTTVKGKIDTIIHLGGNFPAVNDTKIEVVEQWEFDPITRVTEVTILGIAPVRELYVEKTQYRGHFTIFWIKWDEIRDILLQNDQAMGKAGFQKYLWCDYFKYSSLVFDTQSHQRPQVGSIVEHDAIRKLSVVDTVYFDGHLSLTSDGAILSQIIFNNVQLNKFAAYSDSGDRLKRRLISKNIQLWHKRDTVEVEDSFGTVIKKISSVNVNWANISYRCLESWSFDWYNGKTSVAIKGISPDFEDYANRRKLLLGSTDSFPANYSQLFWVRYSDISDILSNYDTWHPLNNFSTNLWNSYFLPQPVR